ncbi:MAG: VCBS repeat-containing protein, partial [Phycisphaerales bacterium]|nr:VCBS repeat-containing protein [Phycisphaerales bacterium]
MVTLAGTANAQGGAAGKLPSFDGPYVFPSDGRSFPWGLAAGDINGDGTPDVAVAHTETNLVLGTTHTGQPGIVRIWQNTGLWDTDPGNGLVLPIDLQIAPNASPSKVALVDLDIDGDLDLVVTSGLAYMPDTNPTLRGVYTVRNDPTGFNTQLGVGKFYYPGGVRSLVVADFNNDGLPDIAAGTDPWEDSNQVGAVHFWENDPSNPGLFIDRGQIGTGHTGPYPAAGVVAGDFNRIAIGGVKLDVVSGNLVNDDISLLTNVSS